MSHGSVLQTPPLPLPLLPLLPPHLFPLPLHHREGDCVSTVDMHRKDERGQQIQLLIQVESGTLNNLPLLFLSRVVVFIIHHLRYYASYLEKYKVVQFFPCMKIEIKRIIIFLVILFLNLKYLEFLSQKLSKHITNVWSLLTASFNCSFLLALVIKTKTCVMALLVPALSKSNPSLIKILIPYRMPMGSRSRIGTLLYT